MSSLEDYEKKLTATSDLEKDELEENLAQIQDMVKIDPNTGFVRIINDNLYTEKEKIYIVATSRLLYNQLQTHLKKEITVLGEVSIDELEKMLHIKRHTLTNRVQDLKRSGQIIDAEQGKIKATTHSINSFLKELSKGRMR